MNEVNILFPHQLFESHPLIQNNFPTYLVEEFLFFRHYKFHKQKIAFHRASMKAYEAYLITQRSKKVNYIDSFNPNADIRKLIPFLSKKGVNKIHYIDTTDDWLEKRIQEGADKADCRLYKYESPLFLNSKEELSHFFRSDKKKFFQTEFYKQQRKKHNILLDQEGNPDGGKWSFDAENRKKYPKSKVPPSIKYPESNSYYEEAKEYVMTNYSENPGKLSQYTLYPTDFVTSRTWLDDFVSTRFAEFGVYEDAIVAEGTILNHSVLTPMLNVGLISPKEIIKTVMNDAEKLNIPINSQEGFVRQVIGWREFIRGVYEAKGGVERTRNFWGFKRKIPSSFYDGTTGIDPIDITIKKVLNTGYCHHIERLMVLGNFMVLCEFNPDEVYRWFMELFIDAYDWVMVPNIYGMSQFADGGLMSTKPYISGSNYLMKMSNYKKGAWQETWDALFWRFMNVHRDFFLANPRLGMLIRTFDKMPKEKQDMLIENAESYLSSLNSK